MTETISREMSDTEPIAPPRPKLSMIERERISPSPLNPRKHFDEASLQELADSIKTHGIQQPIVVRQHIEGRERDGGNTVTYSIVMGERRWRAAALAGMLTVPAIVRTDLDDLKHAELAMEENVRRRDLSVMEEANGYAKLQELGKTQAEIGQGVGVSQSRIANLLRLRELPADVQAMIESGELSTGHGIQLARYKAWPALCLRVAKEIVRCRLPVKDAEKGLSGLGIYTVDGVVVKLSSYLRPAFDWESICPACPFGAYLKEGSSKQGEHHYCMKPDHAAKLEKEAKEEQRRLADIQAHRMREEAMQRTRQAEAAVAAATTKTGTAQAQAEADAAGKASAAMTTETGKPILSKCKYGVIEEIAGSDPAECQAGTCPCRCMAVSAYRGESIVPACADPKRMAKLKAAAEKDKNKNRKVVFDDARARLSALPWDNQATETQGRRMMAMVAWNFLRNCKAEAKKQVAGRLPETGEIGAVRGLLLSTGYEVAETDAFDVLAGISPTDLLGITAEVMLRDDLLARYDYGDTELAKTKAAWFLPAPEAKPDVSAKPENFSRLFEPADNAGTSPLFPCADCKTKDAGAFYVDANGYEVQKGGQFIGDWVCLGDMQKRQATAHEEQLICGRCSEPLTPGAFGEADLSHTTGYVSLRMSSGELAMRGLTFCHVCGPLFDDAGNLISDDEGNLIQHLDSQEPVDSQEPEPWEYDRPDGLVPADGDAVEVLYDGKWLAGSIVGYDEPPSDLVFVLLTGDSAPSLFGPEAVRPAGKREEALIAA